MEDSIDFLLFDDKRTTVVGYSSKAHTEIVIPEGVTRIEDEAFKNLTSLTSIKFSNSVIEIGEDAFEGCTELACVELSNHIKILGNGAFSNCSKLKSIIIPESINYIGWAAFQNCTSLESVEICNNLVTIDSHAFQGCESLPIIDNIRYANNFAVEFVDISKTSVVIQDGTKGICDGLFFDCQKLEHVFIPNCLEIIGNQAFSRCTSLKDIEIPNSVKIIGSGAFSYCTQLEFIEIPYSVTHIRRATFRGCINLKSIQIPDSVKRIDNSAFDQTGITYVEIPTETEVRGNAFIECVQLLNIRVLGVNAYNTSIDGVLYTKDAKKIISFPCGKKGEYKTDIATEEIGSYAFYGSHLTKIYLCENTKEISFYAFSKSKLQEIHIKVRDPKDINVREDAFDDLDGCVLFVPIGSGYAYRHHEAFKHKFTDIKIER